MTARRLLAWGDIEGQGKGQQEEIIGVFPEARRAPFERNEEQGSGKSNHNADEAGDDEPFEDADEQDRFFCEGFSHCRGRSKYSHCCNFT